MRTVIIISNMGIAYKYENVNHVYIMDGILHIEHGMDNDANFIMEYVQSVDIGL